MSELKCPNIKIYKCSDGFVTDNAQVAKSHEANIKSNKLIYPFCNKKLEPIGTSGQFQCGTWGCNASFNFYATRDVWEYIDRTRKALDVAVDALKTIGSGDVIEHSVVGHEDDNKIFIANKALEQITALEQKDK